jgi:hypothetical protein
MVATAFHIDELIWLVTGVLIRRPVRFGGRKRGWFADGSESVGAGVAAVGGDELGGDELGIVAGEEQRGTTPVGCA